MYILHLNFCVIPFNRSRDITIPKMGKTCNCIVLYQATSSKIIILFTKFCTIFCNRIRDRTITRILGKTELLSYIYPICIIVINNDIEFVHKFLCNFITFKAENPSFIECFFEVQENWSWAVYCFHYTNGTYSTSLKTWL